MEAVCEISELKIELEIDDESLVDQIIIELEEDIEYHTKKQQTQMVLESNMKLEKLLHLKALVAHRNLANKPKTEDEILSEEIDKQLKELEIADVAFISNKREELESDITYQTRKSMQVELAESYASLEKLNLLASIVKQRELARIPKSEEDILTEQIEEMKHELAITDESWIIKYIEELQEDIGYQSKRNLSQDLAKSNDKLARLSALSSLIEAREKLRVPKTEVDIMTEDIEKLKQELEITDESVIGGLIEELQIDISYQTKRNLVKELDKSNDRLGKISTLVAMIEKREKALTPKSEEDILNEKICMMKQDLNISDESVIGKLIEELNEDTFYQSKKNLVKELSESNDKLARLSALSSLIEAREKLRVPKTEVDIMTEDIEKLKQELEITDESVIGRLIEELQIDISYQTKRNLVEELDKSNDRLGKISTLVAMIEKRQIALTPITKEDEIINTEVKDDFTGGAPEPAPKESELKYQFSAVNLAEIPNDCAERTLHEMILQVKEGTIDNIELQVETLKKQLINEDQYSFRIQEKIKAINKNDPYLASHILKILRDIQPINIFEIKDLVDRAKQAAKTVEGQEIILFIGETGVGKSTTILYLSKQKMGTCTCTIETGEVRKYIGPIGPLKSKD